MLRSKLFELHFFLELRLHLNIEKLESWTVFFGLGADVKIVNFVLAGDRLLRHAKSKTRPLKEIAPIGRT